MVKTYSFKEISVLLRITPQAVYKLFNNHKGTLSTFVSYSSSGGKLLSGQGLEVLRGFIKPKQIIQSQINPNQPIQPGCSPVEQLEVESNETEGCKPVSGLTTIDLLVERLEKELDAKQQVIDKLIKRLDDSSKQSDEQRQRSDTIIMKLSNDLSNAVKVIEGSRAEIKQLECVIKESAAVPLTKAVDQVSEPEVIPSGWMRKVGNWLFEVVSPGASDRVSNTGSYDFRNL